MKSLKLALLCLCIIILSASSDGKEEDANISSSETWKDKYSSVYKLILLSERSKGKRVELFSATGFSISTKEVDGIFSSLILTNHHFCERINETSFLGVEDVNHNFINVLYGIPIYEVIASDPLYDLCVLRIPGFLKPLEILKEERKNLITEEVVVVGAPGGDFPIILKGFISGKIDISNGQFPLSSIKNNLLLISLKIIHGHSGSPVLTEDGKVIGIIFAAYQSYGGLAISHIDIINFLYLNNIDF